MGAPGGLPNPPLSNGQHSRREIRVGMGVDNLCWRWLQPGEGLVGAHPGALGVASRQNCFAAQQAVRTTLLAQASAGRRVSESEGVAHGA
jgi:hypothetical protein